LSCPGQGVEQRLPQRALSAAEPMVVGFHREEVPESRVVAEEHARLGGGKIPIA
jgi:hypothetical protein